MVERALRPKLFLALVLEGEFCTDDSIIGVNRLGMVLDSRSVSIPKMFHSN